MEAVGIWILFGIASAVVANSKGGSGCTFFIWGVLLGPVGLLWAFVHTPARCPACKMSVHPKATVYPHCNLQLKDRNYA